MERWKEIEGTSGRYFVSDHGRVKSTKYRSSNKEQLLNPGVLKIGYKSVHIRFDNTEKRTRLLVHRLVAECFCEKPKTSEKLEVNHIDLDKLNNHYTNLEWVTSSGNTEHAVSMGRLIPWNNPRKPVKAINIETKEEIMFKSVSDAEKALGTRHITHVLKKQRGQTKGYTFEYIEGGEPTPCN